MKDFIKKHWFIILIIIISLIRFFFSCNLPSFYITNLKYDDKLMINQMISITNGEYLGNYSNVTLVKGVIFPLLLSLIRLAKTSYSVIFTLLYILSSLYFTLSCKKITNNKIILIITYIVLLFNPLTYSSELFQRLYVNTISIPELLIFLGLLIRILYDKKNNILNYILLGIISGIMLITRNDNIWIYIVLIILFIIKIYKNININKIIINLIPIVTIFIIMTVFSSINYMYYKTFTYNELENSSFKDAYNSMLKIKNNNTNDKVSITKDTLLELSEKSPVFNISKEIIEAGYKNSDDFEYDDGNMIWFFRFLVYSTQNFKDGKEANDYFKNLHDDIERLFKENKLEKRNTLPTLYTTSLSLNNIKKIPSALYEAIIYTSTYQNVKTYPIDMIKNDIRFMYSKNYNSYTLAYYDYRYAENIIKDNSYPHEIIRIIYKYLTCILSIISLIVYIINIKKKDNLNTLTHLILLIYLIILGGVVYTDISAFHAIRYRYLSNVYILQSIFIILNLIRAYDDKYLTKIKQIIKK